MSHLGAENQLPVNDLTAVTLARASGFVYVSY